MPLHLRSGYFFVAFDKFVVADETIDGDKECAGEVKNQVLHGVTQGGMTAERFVFGG